MKQSQLFTRTRKEAPRDEASLNAQLLIRAGFVDKVMAGVYTLLPLGLRVFKKIENIIREEMVELGASELLMPTLNPKENWEKTGRWDTLDNLFRFKSHYSQIEYALGATHEEIISPTVKKFVSSYKELPFATFQIQNKFRDEKRAKSGVLRGREFFMKDLYSFHMNAADLEKYYEEAARSYRRIFERAGIGENTYYTYASGGSFAKYSHEFQAVTEAGEDTIYICDKCRVAVNDEIIADLEHKCPECGSEELRSEKAVEVGNIFKLANKFSAPFELKYRDKEGSEHDVLMGCYGIGLNRLMGTAVELSHDEKGIIWPEGIAPFKVHLIEVKSQNSQVTSSAEKVYTALKSKGIEVLYDDREVSAGEKFADSDLIGIPLRVVISEKSLEKGGVEVKKRNEKESAIVAVAEFLATIA
ncbi:MAG TPA: His/Gly/Thr/Pro-type tRNA ligase C-terminal domain-containing protein [Candidatus Moranbacteria bacterium]|nr:His/Gly/Thr/Pro-type tRNA ligase C-terminal domain-containing protein [Candidatus Moranbacteria bacterium]